MVRYPSQWTVPVTVDEVTEMPTEVRKRLVRPRDDRWIGGVCSGIGRKFGIAPNLVRFLFVLSCLLPGPQFLIYIMLWLIIPGDRSQTDRTHTMTPLP